MRITGAELRKIIKEEVSRHFMNEEEGEKVFDFSDEPVAVTAVDAAELEKKKKALMDKLAKRGIKLDTSAIDALVAAD